MTNTRSEPGKAFRRSMDIIKSSVGANIRTDRLVLRPLNVEDAVWINPENSRLAIPRRNPALFAELFILIMRAREQTCGDMMRVICEAESGAPAGVIGLHPHGQGWMLGCWIRETARGQGYAREATCSMKNQARETGRTPLIPNPYASSSALDQGSGQTGFEYTGDTLHAFSFRRMTNSKVRPMAMAG